MPSLIYIFGTSHLLQFAPPICLRPNHSIVRMGYGQKRFALEILKLLCEFDIDFVGEEANSDWDSITEKLMRIGGGTYAHLDMPLAEKKRRNFLSPTSWDFALTAKQLEIFYLCETYMFERACEYMTDASRGLIVCGYGHVPGLAKLFGSVCSDVRTDDVCSKAWWNIADFT